GYALAAYPQRATARRARGYPQRHRTVECRYAQVHPGDRLDEGDRHGERQVVPVPAEQRVLADLDEHVQVAGRPAALPRLAPAGDADPLPVGDTGRDADGHGARLGDTARPVALRALLVHDRTHALAVAAGLGQAERALVVGDQAGAVTDRARPRR